MCLIKMETESTLEEISPVVETTLLPDQSSIETIESDSKKIDESTSCSDLRKDSTHEYSPKTIQKRREAHCCNICGKGFLYKSRLSRHKKVHSGEKPISCGECGRCFSVKANLLIHMRIHRGEKPYSCSDCDKCFRSKSNLVNHTRIHTGEKPFSCSECGQCFSQKSNLLIHMRFHTGEKPLPCTHCGKCFQSMSLLSSLKKLHKRVPSFGDWSQVFVDEIGRLKPIKPHTNNAAFSCSVCGLRFVIKSMLLSHKKVHPSLGRDRMEISSQNGDLSQQQATVEGEKIFLVDESSSSDMPLWQKNESKTILTNVVVNPRESLRDIVEEEVDPLEELSIKEEVEPSQDISLKQEINPIEDIMIKEELTPLEEEFVKEEGNPF